MARTKTSTFLNTKHLINKVSVEDMKIHVEKLYQKQQKEKREYIKALNNWDGWHIRCSPNPYNQ